MANAEQHFIKAADLHRAGKFSEAINIYLSLIKRNEFKYAAMHNLGNLYLSQGKLKSGVDLIDEVYLENPLDPNLPHSCQALGTILYEKQFWVEAEKWLQRALYFFPADTRLQWMLNRVKPRSYLAPEVYDPLRKRILTRASPKEANTYIYTLDIAGTCNLRCPSCPVGNSDSSGRPKGMMPLQLFKDILEKINFEKPCSAPQIWLYNWGEPLLHPKLPEMIGIINELGFSAHISTNLNIAKNLEEVVNAEPAEIKISLSGMTEDNYSFSHRRGNIKRVKSNMFMLRSYIDKLRKNIRVWVGQHHYKHNHLDIQLAADLCRELGFEHYPTQAYLQPLEKVVETIKFGTNENDSPITESLLQHPKDTSRYLKSNRSGLYDCELRFNQTVINHNGEVALCCNVYDQKNMLGLHFLEHSHNTIEQKKYNHPFCITCNKYGYDFSPLTIHDLDQNKGNE